MDRQPVFEFIHYPEFGEAEKISANGKTSTISFIKKENKHETQ